jgi:hypothetical protein
MLAKNQLPYQFFCHYFLSLSPPFQPLTAITSCLSTTIFPTSRQHKSSPH